MSIQSITSTTVKLYLLFLEQHYSLISFVTQLSNRSLFTVTYFCFAVIVHEFDVYPDRAVGNIMHIVQ